MYAKFHARTAHTTVPKQFSQVGLNLRRANPLTRDDQPGQNFPTSPQNKITKLTHCSIYMTIRKIAFPQIK